MLFLKLSLTHHSAPLGGVRAHDSPRPLGAQVRQGQRRDAHGSRQLPPHAGPPLPRRLARLGDEAVRGGEDG
eukprot:474686-Pyramimonas_sp.AAC.1